MEEANKLYSEWIEASPFTSWLGLQVHATTAGLEAVLPFEEKNVGNPFIRSLHGGIISAAMECGGGLLAAQLHGLGRIQRPSSISISYLRSTSDRDLNIQVLPVKTGRRLSFLTAQAWQESMEKPVAIATMTFLRKMKEV
ncbi:PaaI family thioesterase [Kordiimonas sp.]|uniref:PaaI family thioesterase n=1 Tax=Kordiimonas sp. TaxID=1970157 RepID=UPI003B524E35